MVYSMIFMSVYGKVINLRRFRGLIKIQDGIAVLYMVMCVIDFLWDTRDDKVLLIMMDIHV